MATKISVYREAARLLGDVRLATLTDDLPLRHAFDDAWDATVEFVLRQAYWNFALKTIIPDESVVPPIIGFTHVWDLPCDWLRTHSLFVPKNDTASLGHEYPFNCRYQLEQIHSNVTPIYLRYLSSDMADPELWPEHFSNAMAARLAYECAERVTGNPARTEQMFQLWTEALARAAPVDAIPVDPWLLHQLDGTFETASRTILQAGNWRFALKSVTLTAEVLGSPYPGFSNSYAKPVDWVRTQALFVLDGVREMPIEAREHSLVWSANTAPVVRYVSTDGLDARLWPEDFRRVVIAHLGIDMGDSGVVQGEDGEQRSPLMWPEYLKIAIAREAIRESPWLAAQFDGSFLAAVRAMLGSGFWRFAIKSAELNAGGTPMAGFTYAFGKPADWLKTQGLWRISGARELAIDAREHANQWSANVTPIVVRYLSDDATNASTWPPEFERTVAAYLGIDIGDGLPVQGGAGNSVAWPGYLADALSANAERVSPWLRFQFDGSLSRGVRWLLDQANWRFAVRTVEMTAGVDHDLLANGDFDVDSVWAKGTGWTIISGRARHAAAGSNFGQSLIGQYIPLLLEDI